MPSIILTVLVFVMWIASVILVTMYKIRGYNLPMLSNTSTSAGTSMKERKGSEIFASENPKYETPEISELQPQ